MDNKPENTRELLIVTAGELFAYKGFDGVSTRMITDKADLKQSSIHYHFGSKKNLYLESFSYAKRHGARSTFTSVMEENPALAKTARGQAEIIKTTIFRRYHENFSSNRPAWETNFLVREVVNPSKLLPALIDKVFKPEIEAADSFFRLVRPEASDLEIYTWGDMFHSQHFFYISARVPIQIIRGEVALSTEYVQQAARNLSRAMILMLELPLPHDLQ